MNHEDYLEGLEISTKSYSFYGLLCAMIRQADSENLRKIECEWPDEVEIFRRRYDAPGGFLPGEEIRHK